jgi:hypothetical protein
MPSRSEAGFLRSNSKHSAHRSRTDVRSRPSSDRRNTPEKKDRHAGTVTFNAATRYFGIMFNHASGFGFCQEIGFVLRISTSTPKPARADAGRVADRGRHRVSTSPGYARCGRLNHGLLMKDPVLATGVAPRDGCLMAQSQEPVDREQVCLRGESMASVVYYLVCLNRYGRRRQASSPRSSAPGCLQSAHQQPKRRRRGWGRGLRDLGSVCRTIPWLTFAEPVEENGEP